MLGRNIGSKSFITDWRINERSAARGHYCEAKGTERAPLFLLVRFRRVPAAIVGRGWHFHFRVATRLLDLRSRRLPRDRGHPDRAGEDQAKQKAQGGSHRSQFTPVTAFDQPSVSGRALWNARLWLRLKTHNMRVRDAIP